MKNSNRPIEVTNFYNAEADALLKKDIPKIQQDIKSYAMDLARQSRPKQNDPQQLFIPKIKGLFEAFLENLLRIIGAFAVLADDRDAIEKQYEQLTLQLKTKQDGFLQDQRLLQKELEDLQDVSGLIRRWIYKWRIVLIGISIGETAINYKVMLLVTSNVLTASIASAGLCASLFIISHSFKDILAYFQSKGTKIAVALGNVIGVLVLLYSFNELRISFMETESGESAEVSAIEFLAINFTMWISGTVIAFLYKPLKSIIAKHKAYNRVETKLQEVNAKNQTIVDRLEAIPKELHQKLVDIQNLRVMAKHYENTVVSEYHSCVALFVSENLFRRKDGITAPKAFLEETPKLRTYFDHIIVTENTSE